MRVAAFDIGSNSIHLVVADVRPDGGYTLIERSRQQVELGRGGFGSHRITDEAMARALRAMESFADALKPLGVEVVHACATSAVREAQNGAELCDRIAEATGIHVHVVSGVDEGRLIWLGARQNLDPARSPALLVDIGGGSVELVVGDPQRVRAIHSLPLGHIRITDAFVRSDPPALDEIQAIRKHVRQLMTVVIEDPSTVELAATLGTSGSIRTLGRMATLMRGDPVTPHDHGLVLGRSELKKLLERLVSVRSTRLEEIPGMDPRRRATLPAAAAVLYQIMKSLSIETLSTSESALREGLLFDWIERHRPEIELSGVATTPRMRSVLHLMDRYGADRPHSEQVARLALALFDALNELHGLGDDSRALLEYGALLHDIGHHIDARDHHRHGEYLIQNSPMPGFTSPETTLVGTLVRYHRGVPKPGHRTWQSLTRANQRRVEILSAMLRMADALDRSHHQPIDRVSATVRPEGVMLTAHAREEAFLERWAAERRVESLASVLGRPVQLVLMDASFVPNDASGTVGPAGSPSSD
ncbi:MAG: Ppx/GppA phosphatase family protein [Myxococcota bacterium]